MKTEKTSKPRRKAAAEMRREYSFDFRKARPNRFASIANDEPQVVMVDPDIAEVFTTPESVNEALRALITAFPKRGQSGLTSRR
jgi:hypothetical protein